MTALSRSGGAAGRNSRRWRIWRSDVNTRGRHSALGHLSPSEYEEVRLRVSAVAQRQTVRGDGANPNPLDFST